MLFESGVNRVVPRELILAPLLGENFLFNVTESQVENVIPSLAQNVKE